MRCSKTHKNNFNTCVQSQKQFFGGVWMVCRRIGTFARFLLLPVSLLDDHCHWDRWCETLVPVQQALPLLYKAIHCGLWRVVKRRNVASSLPVLTHYHTQLQDGTSHLNVLSWRLYCLIYTTGWHHFCHNRDMLSTLSNCLCTSRWVVKPQDNYL